MPFNNPPCEDAPCCGCCGAAVAAAEARADEEAAYDRQFDEYDPWADDDVDEPDDDVDVNDPPPSWDRYWEKQANPW